MAFDAHTQFHETWLGMVQPVEGLVVSIPVLVEAQTMDRHGPELQDRLQSVCPMVNADTGLEIDDVSKARTKKQRSELVKEKLAATRRFREITELLEQLLGWTADLYDRGDALPEDLKRYIAEGHQTIRPTLALRKLVVPAPAHSRAPTSTQAIVADDADLDDDEHDDGEEGNDADGGEGDGAAKPSGRSLTAMPDIETPESLAGKPYLALVWDLPTGLDLDKPETKTGDWRYPPSAKFERLLRAARVPIGLLTNGEVIRLVYAPHGEASGSITFGLTDMGDVGGRPILDAFVMLLSAQRFFGVRPEDALPALLRRSRERQANVTNTLAAQVFDALDLLLRGFEQAAGRDRHADVSALLRRDDPDDPEGAQDDHLYGGLLTVLLRLVFVLYAEDRELLPTNNELYARSLSLGQMFEDLQRDHDAFPDTMGRRFGAWSRMLSLFRTIHDGVEHGSLHIPRRRGELFNPSRFPFLENWGAPDSPVERDLSEVGVPTIDDETVFRVLERLMYLEGQRLSYKVLSVEQIGSVYEALMGYGVERLGAAAVCCGHRSLQKGSTGGVWIEAGSLLATSPGSRSKVLVVTYNVEKGAANRIADDLTKANTEVDLLTALDRIALKKVTRRGCGQLVLQPGEERRRTSSHYTPRTLSEPIVRKTLEPLLRAMSPTGEPSSRQLLSLKICDPAMGSGAFLVEACRFLGDHVVAAWEREGQMLKVASAKEDVVNYARRLVAQTCLYGVDKNPFAVSLAKLSLWLETFAKQEPFTFIDHALKHGDSLVGLSLEQLKAFHWAPAKNWRQVDLIEQEIFAAIEQAVELRHEILTLAGSLDPDDGRHKERLLWDAEDAIERIRVIGDLVVGAFFSAESAAEREAERVRRLDLVRTWLSSGEPMPPQLSMLSREMRRRTPVFHWNVEFPEVFWAERADPLDENQVNRVAWIDAFVGNPPFAGKNNLISSAGARYLPWLKVINENAKANADLSAHFLFRCYSMLGDHGALGFITSDAISEGDSRVSALLPLFNVGACIYSAAPNQPWPTNDADVRISIVHLAAGNCRTSAPPPELLGVRVSSINTRLVAGTERGEPQRLCENDSKCFVGNMPGGPFDVGKDDVARLHARRGDGCVYRYIRGEDINKSPIQTSDAQIIYFSGASLESVMSTFPDALELVRERVKPLRDGNPRASRRDRWWLHSEECTSLYTALFGLTRCLVVAQSAKHFAFAFQPTDRVFSNTVMVFPDDSDSSFAVLQSRVHLVWASMMKAGHGGQGNVSRYRGDEIVATFPWPPQQAKEALSDVGKQLNEARASHLVAMNYGFTRLYDLLKEAQCDAPEVLTLRVLHVELDRAVLAAYGWSDLAVPPYTTPVTSVEGTGLAVFENEILDRLFALNARRAAEEKALGAATATTARKTKSRTTRPRGRKKAADAQIALGDKGVKDE